MHQKEKYPILISWMTCHLLIKFLYKFYKNEEYNIRNKYKSRLIAKIFIYIFV